ncbi:MAG: lysophospholipid acyltransferase family protein [Candidatus Krumholzibacteria bacterium]|jgi:KDO2-lipid IV(A) lauroyltransferase|nr:lysophospholipid acyltransferase family protein [Candidatus Krumholzibacteria bacterium]
MDIQRPGTDLVDALLRALARLAQALPESRVESVGRQLGRCWFHLVRYRRRQALAGLRLAFGGRLDEAALHRLCRENFEHYGVVLVEFLRLPRLSDRALQDRYTINGLEYAARARARGKGLIIVTAHIGNWEYLAAAQASWGLDMLVITRRAHQPGVDRYWQRVRRARGVRFVDAYRSLGEVLRHLRRGGTVAMSIDQHEGGTTGVRVPFFGREAGTVKAPALLAARTGCPVILLLSWRGADGRQHAVFSEEIPLAADADLSVVVDRTTRRYNALLEEFILAHPSQWAWVHRRWKPA